MPKRKHPKKTIKINHKWLKFDEKGHPIIIQGSKTYKAQHVEIDDQEYFKVKGGDHTVWVVIDYADV